MRFGILRPLWIAFAVCGGPPAWACSVPALSISLIAPADGTKDIPADAKIWFGVWVFESVTSDPFLNFELLDLDGNSVPTSRSQIDSGGQESIVSFTPRSRLTPGSRYRVRSAPYLSETSFTVTSEELISRPPPIPSAHLIRTYATRPGQVEPCGPSYFGLYDLTRASAIFSVFDLGGTAQLPAPGTGRVSGFSARDTLYVTWQGARQGQSRQVRFGAINISGDFSGWSDYQTITIKGGPMSGGCVRGEDLSLANSGVWLLPFLGLLKRRRKG